MNKNRKILMVLVGALILSVLAGIGVFQTMSNRKVAIYVFNGNYPAGTKLTPSMMTTLQVDEKMKTEQGSDSILTRFIGPDNIKEAYDVADTLRTDVYAGQYLTPSMLTKAGMSDVEYKLSPDKIAVTVPLNQITGITNNLKAGSYLNLTVLKANDEYDVLQKVLILKLTSSEGELASATFECDFEQAVTLQTCESIYAGLIHSDSYKEYTGNVNAFIEQGITSSSNPSVASVPNTPPAAEVATVPSSVSIDILMDETKPAAK